MVVDEIFPMHKKLIPLAACFLVVCTAPVRATVQAHDAVYIGKTRGFCVESPIDPLLEKRKLEFEMISTAQYSGYEAGWTIAGDNLYLSVFHAQTAGRPRNLVELFPGTKTAILADWYTGPLHVHLGEIKLRAIHGHVVATESLRVCEVVKGKIVYDKTLKYPDNIDEINRITSVFLGERIDIRTSKW